MTVSIIVPVYNVEPFLQECLNSLLSAMGKDDEMILSLGPSTDRSSEICCRFQQQDSRIRLVYQNGKGLSNARNCAIREAMGDYIVCVDSDDYVDTPSFRELLDQMREGAIHEDVIAHDYWRFDRRNGKMVPFFQIGDIPDQVGDAFMPHMIRKRQCFWNVWRYIYRREFLQKNNITYRENTLSEDIDYTTSVFLKEPSVRFVHCPFYVYTVGRGDSLMDRPTFRRLSDTALVLEDAIRRWKEAGLGYASVMVDRFQFEYILNMALTVEIDPADRKAARELYRNWKVVLSGSRDPMIHMVVGALYICGTRIVSYGLHSIKIVRRLMHQCVGKRRTEG